MTDPADDPTIAHYLRYFDEAMTGGSMPEAQRLMLRQTVAGYLTQLSPERVARSEAISARLSQLGPAAHAMDPQLWVSEIFDGQGAQAAGDQGIGAQLMSGQTMGGQMMAEGAVGAPIMGQELDGTPIQPASRGGELGRIVLISIAVIVVLAGLVVVGRFFALSQ